MKTRLLLLITLLVFMNTYAQVGFEDHIIIDELNFTDYPTNIYSADLNNDGYLDILIASTADDKISWLKNLEGSGDFDTLQIITTNADAAKSVFAADLDGDGDLDVLSASSSDNKIAWYENLDGQGNFGSQQIINANAEGASSVYAADLDGDGDMDVLSTSYTDDTVYWYENIDGLGDFSYELTISTTANGATMVYASDLDGDGDIDVISSSANDHKIAWYENTDGLGTFIINQIITEEITYNSSIYTVDIDGDGDLDVLSALEGDNKVAWYENTDGFGNFGIQQIITTNAEGANSVYATDIDGDGDMDILSTSRYDNKVAWYENIDGLGDFDVQQIITTNVEGANSVYAVDIDNDGDIDVISASDIDDKIAWYENVDGFGNFGSQNNLTGNADEANAVYATDIDGDGDLDVVSSSFNDGKIAWYNNLDGLGNFGLQNTITTNAAGIESIYFADIDGDSDIDILSASRISGSKIAWYENVDGLGNFSEQQIISTIAFAPYSVFATDLDGDGDIDVLSASEIDDKIAWYENTDGLGNFGPQQVITTNASSARSVFSSDIDGDGDMDVLSASYSDDKIAWYENTDGLGNFGSQQIITNIGDGANTVYSSDIDGDGDMDVIAIFLSDSRISWNENLDGLGNFGVQQIISNTINSPRGLYTSDIDNDGDLDVLSASQSDNTIIWFENEDGEGTFSSEQIISNEAEQAYAVYSADIDNDGDMDVLSASKGDDKIAWYDNLGILGNQIFGNIMLDLDTNGCDPNDLKMSNLYVVADNGTNTFSTLTNINGNYLINVNEGTFTTSIISEFQDYLLIDPDTHTSNFVGLGNTYQADFCIEPIGTINDLNISVYPLNDARPGFEVTYQIVYRNVGTTILTDALELTFDETKISYIEASQAPVIQSSNSLTFDYYDLLPFETRTVDITFNVFAPPTTEIGDILAFTAVISPVAGDYTEEDNTFNFDQTVIGAYDPNDIQVMEGDEIYESETDNYLHYIIRFQNLGTAEAINVSVSNILDPNLDWNTLQIENISHTNRVEIRDGNQVEFIFDNINLPDSTSNEEESHGFIQYKIKPKNTVGLGDSMSNTADIFFDFNPAVATNTVTTTVVENLSVGDNTTFKSTIYPNPTTGELHIKSNITVERIVVFNQLGQVVLEQFNDKGINAINLNELTQGIYFLKLTDSNNNFEIKKLIKE